MFRYFLVLMYLVCGAAVSHAQSLQEQLVPLAEKVAKTLQSSGQTSVTIQVNGPPTFTTAGPSMVKELLGTELKRLGIEIKLTGASVAIRCELTFKKQDAGTTVRLKTELVGEDGTVLVSLTGDDVIVKEQAEVARVLAVPFDRKLDNEPGFVSRGLDKNTRRQSFDSPTESIIRVKAGSEYGLEILVGNQPRGAESEGGLAVIPLNRNEEFTIRLYNDSTREVGVQLTLDGVDSLWFTPRKGGLWLVPPRSQIIVPGWQKDMTRATKFRVTPFADSIAALAGVQGEVGTITAEFSNAYQLDEEIPDHDRRGQTKSLDGLGQGGEFENRVNIVKRKFGKPIANIPVRYAR